MTFPARQSTFKVGVTGIRTRRGSPSALTRSLPAGCPRPKGATVCSLARCSALVVGRAGQAQEGRERGDDDGNPGPVFGNR